MNPTVVHVDAWCATWPSAWSKPPHKSLNTTPESNYPFFLSLFYSHSHFAPSQWLPPPLSPSTSHIQQHQRSLLTLNFRPLRNLPNSNPAPLLPAKTSAPPTPSLSLLPEKTQPLQFFSLRLLANLSLCSLLSTF